MLAIYHEAHKNNVLIPHNYQKFLLLSYNDENIAETIADGIEYLKNTEPTRFNLLIEPELLNYVKEKAKKNNTSTAACIRQLIIDDRAKTI